MKARQRTEGVEDVAGHVRGRSRRSVESNGGEGRGWSRIWPIFWTFFTIGPVTFGGGYAMIPAIEREVVARRRWIDDREMAEVLSVAGSAPGGIGVNAATFIGYRLAGIRGAVAAVLGITVPTFLIVIALSLAYVFWHDNPKVAAAFLGLRSGIVALIVYAGYKMARSSIFDKSTFVAAAATVALLLAAPVHPIVFIAIGALSGIAIVAMKRKLGIAIRLNANGEEAARNVDDSGYYVFADYYVADGI